MGCNKSNVTRPWNREHLMGAAIPSFIWGHQFLVFVIIMGDRNQIFTPTSLCCFYALLELFSYEHRGFKQLPHSPIALGGRSDRIILGSLNSYKRWEEKLWCDFKKKLSYQTNNCQFLVSINSKIICNNFLFLVSLFLQGWPAVYNEFIRLGPKKLAGPHRYLPVRQELVLEAIPASTTHPHTGYFSVPVQAH